MFGREADSSASPANTDTSHSYVSALHNLRLHFNWLEIDTRNNFVIGKQEEHWGNTLRASLLEDGIRI